MDKQKLFNIKNFIKDESNSIRLQSLKLPRDLSLGGTKPKKVYTPNLNVVRKKDQPRELKRPDYKKKENNCNKLYKRNENNKQRYIQSSGVFSEGAGEVRRTLYRGGERSISMRDTDTVSGMVLPTINHNIWSVNKKAEDVILDKLVGCDDMDQDDIKFNFEPIELPNNVYINKNISGSKNIKKEKKECSSNDTKKLFPVPVKLEDNCHLPIPFANDKMFGDDYPALTVFKMPHSLAGKGLSDDPNCKQLFDYPLHATLDGQIGKLCIRRSGKMEIHLGAMKYALEEVGFSAGTSDVVSFVSKGNEQNETGMVVLGDVKNFFALVPTWQKLL